MHGLESRNGLGYILAVVAVDYPGRGPRAIQEDLEMDDGGIRVRRLFRRPFRRDPGNRRVVDGFRLKVFSAGGGMEAQ